MLATEAPFPQYFDIDGDPLDGGKLYFGLPNQDPETNPIPVYWDVDGTQPAAQPIRTMNGYSVRSGAPALVYVDSDYSINVRNKKGELVYYAPNSAEFSNDAQFAQFIDDLANATDPTKGDALVGVKQPFTGAVAMTQHQKNAMTIHAADFGVTFDNLTDDTEAWSDAVRALGPAGGTLLGKPGGTSFVGGADGILVPSNVIIDLQGGLLRGTGNDAAGNTLINSAYYNAGVLTLNTEHGAVPPGSVVGLPLHPVSGAQVRNGTLYRAGFAMRLRFCTDACAFENLRIVECFNGIYAEFCLYARFENITARNGAANIAFNFSNNCNAITLKNLYALGNAHDARWAVGFLFDFKSYAIKLLNCSSERCVIGIKTEEVNGFSVDGHYMEDVTTGIDFQGSGAGRKVGVEVTNCFFGGVDHIVVGRTVNNFVWEASNQRYLCEPGDIDLLAELGGFTNARDATCTGVVRLNDGDLQKFNPHDGRAPAWLKLCNTMSIEGEYQAVAQFAGLADPAIARSILVPTPSGMVPFGYSGYANAVGPGDDYVLYADVVKPVSATSSPTIYTTLGYSPSMALVFFFEITDDNGTSVLSGRAFGSSVYKDNSTPNGIGVSNNAGFVRLDMGTFNNASGTMKIWGYCRHM